MRIKNFQFNSIVVVLVNRELSEGPVNWPHVSRRNHQNRVGALTVGNSYQVGNGCPNP